MRNTGWGWIFLAGIWPVWIAGQTVLVSAPNLPIPDASCLDPALGRGEGGIEDSIAIPGWILPNTTMRVEVEIDHGWRSDLQIAVAAGTASLSGLTGLNGNASSTPVLANGHDSFGNNYYATFDDRASRDCSASDACGNPNLCVSADEEIHCRPDEPIFGLLAASATPQVVSLRICDREAGISGILRRWRLFVSVFVPVELQSFSVD